ncbi:23115_t:CDS:2 [Cetraspora pellucida]|uniref:23115_t:CDS:1 n=1 Tax=Cetraspora pellucida TaxID=1433469 RepID=A0A9N8VFJ2_9GLOM|nr:23115_t:CDS:2 [Cetraspora pellucida]
MGETKRKPGILKIDFIHRENPWFSLGVTHIKYLNQLIKCDVEGLYINILKQQIEETESLKKRLKKNEIIVEVV